MLRPRRRRAPCQTRLEDEAHPTTRPTQTPGSSLTSSFSSAAKTVRQSLMLAGEPFIPSHDKLLCLPATAGRGRGWGGAEQGAARTRARPSQTAARGLPIVAPRRARWDAGRERHCIPEPRRHPAPPSLARGRERSQNGSYIVNLPLHLWHVMELCAEDEGAR